MKNMKGKFPIIIRCWIFGHIECQCTSCSADKEYAGKQYTKICKTCDGDYWLNFIALPKRDDCASLEICDNCDDKEATRCRGDGIYRSAICDTCYFRYIVGKPFD